MEAASPEQLSTCARVGSAVVAINADSKIGVARESLSRSPLSALRYPAKNAISGWYFWGGEFSVDANFFQVLPAKHVMTLVPALVPYLALAPGWRVLLDRGQEYLWFDSGLLNV
jgi:hypothetical protein